MHDQARRVVKDLLASHAKDPSAVATEKMRSLKLDLSAVTLEVGMGLEGSSRFGLKPDDAPEVRQEICNLCQLARAGYPGG
jgi:hypothetical protein